MRKFPCRISIFATKLHTVVTLSEILKYLYGSSKHKSQEFDLGIINL